jgi:hypothetical protein
MFKTMIAGNQRWISFFFNVLSEFSSSLCGGQFGNHFGFQGAGHGLLLSNRLGQAY